MNDDMTRRVHRGMNWLDYNRPGWKGNIDLSILDMRNNNRCVLGQLYGSYFSISYALGVNPSEYGFDDKDCDYDNLTKAWRDALLPIEPSVLPAITDIRELTAKHQLEKTGEYIKKAAMRGDTFHRACNLLQRNKDILRAAGYSVTDIDNELSNISWYD